ncbi:MAG: alpha/beta fold hydrolase [Deltaproteobacteria bacterium]|nr:alpha/beta fold hydrolase [Deltaproteobacteria bacterium]
MESLNFIQDLAVVMLVAGLVTLLFRRLKQPVVLGYIIAGFILGPHTPPFSLIKNEESIHTLSDLGIIFLMFSLGLHFSLRRIKQVGLSSLIAAVIEIIFMVVIGYGLGRYFQWSEIDSIFLGAILAISSTTIIVKVLHDMDLTREKFAELIFGILVMEDILAIALIALLSSIALTGTLQIEPVVDTLGRLGMFLTVTMVLGLLGVPFLLKYVARFKSNETLLIIVLALCFGVSLLAIKLGFSMALGAFLIGVVIAEVRTIGKIDHLVEPIRDMFSAIFFVTVGLMIDPQLLAQYIVPITAITVAVIVGKVLTCSVGTFAAGTDLKTSMRVGMGLAQIGEFSFIIAALGDSLDVTSPFLYPIAVTVSAVTTLCTPYLIRSADPLVSLFDRIAPKAWLKGIDRYSRWVHSLSERNRQNTARQKIMGQVWHLLLDLVLLTALFFAADFVAEHVNVWGGDINFSCWIAAMVLSLPLLVSILKKLNMLGGWAASLSGLIVLGGWIHIISATLFPSRDIVVGSVVVLVGITALLWKHFSRIYSHAQKSIETTINPQYHQINNAFLHFVEQGKAGGVPVIFIHGFPLDHTMWTPQLKALPPWSFGVAYDVRGLGESEMGVDHYTMETYADDLVALMDYLKLKKCVICGLSMGGYIALRAVERNPERFMGLVLCDTRSEADTSESRIKRGEQLKLVQEKGVSAFVKEFAKLFYDPKTLSSNPKLPERILKQMEASSPKGIEGGILALAVRSDTTEGLSKIKIPTLILVGEHDALTPVANAKSLHQKIAGSELHIISDAGHLSNLENSKEFNQHLVAFLEKHFHA